MCLCRTHCNAELMAQKELCEERVAAAKHEVETRMKKLSPSQGESLQVKRHFFMRTVELGKILSSEVILAHVYSSAGKLTG